MTFWSAEKTEQLRQLHDLDFTSAEIAAELDTTREVVRDKLLSVGCRPHSDLEECSAAHLRDLRDAHPGEHYREQELPEQREVSFFLSEIYQPSDVRPKAPIVAANDAFDVRIMPHPGSCSTSFRRIKVSLPAMRCLRAAA